MSDERAEVLEYGLLSISSTLFTTLLLTSVAWVARALGPTLVAAGVGATLRQFSGGAHFSTPARCALMSTVVYGLAGALAAYLPVPAAGALVFMAALLLPAVWNCLWRWAPVASDARPLHPRERQRYRVFSLAALVAFAAAWGAAVALEAPPRLLLAACLGLAAQTITLTPVGIRFTAKIDLLLSPIFRGEVH